jgi:uncharacterized protein (TIGR03086 family)
MIENSQRGPALLGAAHEVLRTAVAGVPRDGWGLSSPCEKWTVTQVLQHAAGDQMAYASVVTGGPAPAENPFEPSGKIDGDPVAYLGRALESSAAAWESVASDADSVPTPLPQGDLPMPVAVGACALDAAVHGWDMAAATGQPSRLGPGLARSWHEVAIQIVEPLRQYGAYAPALDPEAGDDETAALLRYLGRRPDWTR